MQPSMSRATISSTASRRVVLLAPTVPALIGSLPGGNGANASSLPSSPSSSVLPLIPQRTLAFDASGKPLGYATSAIIKGCWQLSGGHRGDKDTDRTQGKAAVEDFEAFRKAGISTFDTADIYGPSEALIGRYLESYPTARSSVRVHTKYCMFGGNQYKQSAGDVERRIDLSRSRLKQDKLDLVQFYWNDYDVPYYTTAALGLMDLQAKGKIEHVGTTNFDVKRLEEMEGKGARFVTHQVQYSLLDRRAENYLVDYCKAKHQTLVCYGTVAGGFLSDKYLDKPASSVSLDTYSKRKYASIIGEAGGWEWYQSLLRVLKQVGDKHGQSISNVAVKWVLDRPCVAGAIVGARNADHVADHQRVFLEGFELDSEDRGRIDEVLAKGKRARGDFYDWERGGVW